MSCRAIKCFAYINHAVCNPTHVEYDSQILFTVHVSTDCHDPRSWPGHGCGVRGATHSTRLKFTRVTKRKSGVRNGKAPRPMMHKYIAISDVYIGLHPPSVSFNMKTASAIYDETLEQLGENSRCFGQDSNQTPPEYESTALPLGGSVGTRHFAPF